MMPAATPDDLLPRVLGPDWQNLPAPVRRLHQIGTGDQFAGIAEVRRGRHPLARLIAWLFRFPEAAATVTLLVTKTRTGQGEIWLRQFADRRFRSTLQPSRWPGQVVERLGPCAFELASTITTEAHSLTVVAGGFLGVPLPGWALPQASAREYASADRYHFDISLSAPFGIGLIVHYRGWLEPVTRPGVIG